ncbi:MAG: Spy/CpxP family protein refolding chaperone [Deltaproteobacteria bacterium]|nr:Spy/CpxP family protein refolding chaperone [Deltaproteobacteria bacterium]
MRQTFRLIGITAVVLALAVPAALAERGERGGGQGERGHRGGPFAGLDLSADQQTALRELHQTMRAQAEPLRTRMKTNREAAAAVWKSGRPDAARLKVLAKERAALQAELAALRIDTQVAAFSLLSPEQQAQAAERFGRMGKGRHKGFHGERGRRGMGPPPDAPEEGGDE